MKKIFLIMCMIGIGLSTFSSCAELNDNNALGSVDASGEESAIYSEDTVLGNANLICTEYKGRVHSIFEEEGKCYFSVTDYENTIDGVAQNYNFVISNDICFDNTALVDDFCELNVVKVFSFTAFDEQVEVIPAHMVVRIEEAGTTFYAIVTQVLSNQLVLKGLDINDLNHRSFYFAVVEDYTTLSRNGEKLTLEDLSVGDLVSVRYTQGKVETYPSTLERTEEIKLLIKEYTKEVYDYDA